MKKLFFTSLFSILLIASCNQLFCSDDVRYPDGKTFTVEPDEITNLKKINCNFLFNSDVTGFTVFKTNENGKTQVILGVKFFGDHNEEKVNYGYVTQNDNGTFILVFNTKKVQKICKEKRVDPQAFFNAFNKQDTWAMDAWYKNSIKQERKL